MSGKKIWKRMSAAVLAALMVMAGTGCGGDDPAADGGDAENTVEKITFVLDWTPNTNHTGVYAAQELGYYEEAGLEVEIQQPPEDGANMAVASGKAQFGVGFQETLVPALAAEEPLPITAVAALLTHNTSGLISAKDKNITSFKDLEGKSYASWDTPSELAIIEQCMEAEGADFSKLKTVPHSGADALSLMQTGDVDVVWVYEGWDVKMADLAGVSYNFVKFTDAAPVLDYYTPLLIANNSFLEEKPEAAKAFLAATAKGYQYAMEHPEEAAEILCKADPALNKDLVLLSQKFMADQYQAESPKWGIIDKDRWTAFNDWMLEKGLVSYELGSAGYTNDYLPQ